MIAYASGNWQEAIQLFKTVLPNLLQLGGSHTQRYLFKQVYLNALQQSELGFDKFSDVTRQIPKLSLQAS
jgi:hypothetical protein